MKPTGKTRICCHCNITLRECVYPSGRRRWKAPWGSIHFVDYCNLRNGFPVQGVVDSFNANFPVGAKVILRKDSGPIETVVKNAAYLLGGHTPVAFFSGVVGCYSIEGRVTKA